MDQKKEEESKEEESIPDLDQEIIGRIPYENEEEYNDTIKQHIKYIKDSHKISKHFEIINKRITSTFTYKDLYKILLDIYRDRKKCFKINM